MFLKKSSSSETDDNDDEEDEKEHDDDDGDDQTPALKTTSELGSAASPITAVPGATAAAAAGVASDGETPGAAGGNAMHEGLRMFLKKSLSSDDNSQSGGAQEIEAAITMPIPGASGWPIAPCGGEGNIEMDGNFLRGSGSAPSEAAATAAAVAAASKDGGLAAGSHSFSKIEMALAAAAATAGTAAAADIYETRSNTQTTSASTAMSAGPAPSDETSPLSAVETLTAAAATVEYKPKPSSFAAPVVLAPSIAALAADATTTTMRTAVDHPPPISRQVEEADARLGGGADQTGQGTLAPVNCSSSAFTSPCPPESPAPGGSMAQRHQREWMGQPSPAFRRGSGSGDGAAVLHPASAGTPSAATQSGARSSASSTPVPAGILPSVVTPSVGSSSAFSGVFPLPHMPVSSSCSTSKLAMKRPRVPTTAPIAVVPASPWGTGALLAHQQQQRQHGPLSCPTPAAITPLSTATSTTNTPAASSGLRLPCSFPITPTAPRAAAPSEKPPTVTPYGWTPARGSGGSSSGTPVVASTTSTERNGPGNSRAMPVVTPPPLAVLSKARSRAAAAAAKKAEAEKILAAVAERSGERSAERFLESSEERSGQGLVGVRQIGGGSSDEGGAIDSKRARLSEP